MELQASITKKEQALSLIRRGYPLITTSHILSISLNQLRVWVESESQNGAQVIPAGSAIASNSTSLRAGA